MNAKTAPARHRALARLSSLAVLFALTAAYASAQADVGIPGLTAEAALERSDAVLAPDACAFTVRMTVHNPGKDDRVTDFDSWYRKGVGSLMEITAPARSRGTRMLQLDDALWLYSPRSNSGNAIRLSPRDSFQGSSFSNNDVGDHNYADNYDCQWTQVPDIPGGTRLTVDGKEYECAVVTGTARDNKAPYGKILVWLTKDGAIPLRMYYYTRSGLLYRTLSLSNLKVMAGALRPARLMIEAADEEGSWSSIDYLSMDASTPVPDKYFTRQWLTR